jgi:hypothetical protein
MLPASRYNRAYKFSADAFLCWFIVMIIWLPTAIGGWLVYFELLEAGDMWIGSLVISFAVAAYMAMDKGVALRKAGIIFKKVYPRRYIYR